MPNFENLLPKPSLGTGASDIVRDALSKESLSLLDNPTFKTLMQSRSGDIRVPDLKLNDSVLLQLRVSETTPSEIKLPQLKLGESTPGDKPNVPDLKVEPPRYFETLPQIGLFSGGVAVRYNTYLGASLVAGAGAYQAYRDIGHMGRADNFPQRTKFTAAVGTDLAMIGGGVLSVAKYGPKWLAPALMVGGFAGRLALDLIPDKKK